jgi:hypothetical protein
MGYVAMESSGRLCGLVPLVPELGNCTEIEADTAGWRKAMNNQIPKYVTQARASFLLGMSEAELDRISRESGVGHVESAGNEKETYFTYEELQRICVLAGRQIEVVH